MYLLLTILRVGSFFTYTTLLFLLGAAKAVSEIPITPKM